jgi:hypothetical protein
MQTVVCGMSPLRRSGIVSAFRHQGQTYAAENDRGKAQAAYSKTLKRGNPDDLRGGSQDVQDVWKTHPNSVEQRTLEMLNKLPVPPAVECCRILNGT